MITIHNPYAVQENLRVSTSLDEFVDLMEENSLANSENIPDSMKTPEEGSSQSPKEHTTDTNANIDIKEEDTPLPPSFHRTIMEEQLCNDNCPYVFWANI